TKNANVLILRSQSDLFKGQLIKIKGQQQGQEDGKQPHMYQQDRENAPAGARQSVQGEGGAHRHP
ncbi:hypothetical protein, partial [uncultured Fibrobacter sp.]|uniref:hypothetical protein n=1 Tax=uncultured Fibrobacter sp. TaxID=261512 RepID=UPI002595784C